jgi:hypothetical protein
MILYRGQRKDWPLKPSGYRIIPSESDLNKFSQSLVRNHNVFKDDYRIVANLIFEIFNNYDLAYEPKMPEFKSFLKIKDKDTLIKEIDKFMLNFINPNKGYPLNEFLEDFSYFQHYGKNTPMLDFTEDFDSALKFAGMDAATKMEDGVWKFHDFPIQIGPNATLIVFCPEIYFQTAPQWLFSYLYTWDSGTNRNIINQKGICIFCPPSNDDNVFLFLNCYQVYNIYSKTKNTSPVFKLSNQMFDDFYSFETLYKLGGISKDLFKYALNKFVKLYNLKEPNLSVDQELVDFIEKGIEPIHPEKFRTAKRKGVRR